MAEEKSKKPKIDLKARLGKSAAGSSPGGVPLPVPGSSPGASSPPGIAPPAMPTPMPTPAPSGGGIAPPPGMASVPPGISLGSPFAPQPRPAPAAPAPKPSAAQQTIKVEIGEEIHAERKKASKKTALYAFLTLVLGAAFGFAVGGAKERSDRAYVAVEGAASLEKDIKASNDKIRELAEKLTTGDEKLRNKTYPDDLIADLAAINIPFEAGNLENKQIGSFKGTLQRQLFAYTGAVDEVNRAKTTLRNLLGQPEVKKAVEKSWAEEKEPVANFSVILGSDSKGMFAELVPTKEPFPFSKDWPASYTVLRVERSQAGAKQVEKKATRWQKGDPSRDMSGSDPVVIPVEAQSTAALTSQEIIRKLAGGMRDLRRTIEGDSSDPTNEVAGLLKTGDDLVNELHKIALQK